MKDIDSKSNESVLNLNTTSNLRDIVPPDDKQTKARARILFDSKYTRQYSVKIPKGIAETAQLDPEKDLFEFQLEIPSDPAQKPLLKITLVRE